MPKTVTCSTIRKKKFSRVPQIQRLDNCTMEPVCVPVFGEENSREAEKGTPEECKEHALKKTLAVSDKNWGGVYFSWGRGDVFQDCP